MAIVNQIWFAIILFLHFGFSGTRKQTAIIPIRMYLFTWYSKPGDPTNAHRCLICKKEVLGAQTLRIGTKWALTKVNVFSSRIFHSICYDRWWFTKKFELFRLPCILVKQTVLYRFWGPSLGLNNILIEEEPSNLWWLHDRARKWKEKTFLPILVQFQPLSQVKQVNIWLLHMTIKISKSKYSTCHSFCC